MSLPQETKKTKETEENQKNEEERTNPKINPRKTNVGAAAVAAVGAGTGKGKGARPAHRGSRAEKKAQIARAVKAEKEVAQLKAQVAGLLEQVKGGYVMRNEDPGAKDPDDQMVLLGMAVTTAKSSAAASREAAQRAREEEQKWRTWAGIWEARSEKATADMAKKWRRGRWRRRREKQRWRSGGRK